MNRRPFRTALLLIGVCVFLDLMFGPGFLSVPITLLVGWCPASARIIGAWHPKLNAIFLFTSAAILATAGIHWFMRWLYPSLRDERAIGLSATWRWNWTICCCGILFCVLLSIGGIVLTTHQLYWFCKSPDPVFSDPYHEKAGILSIAMTLQKDAERAQWLARDTSTAFWRREPFVAGQWAGDMVQPVWISQDENRLRAIILVPRWPTHRARARLILIQRGAELAFFGMDELHRLLESFSAGQAVTP